MEYFDVFPTTNPGFFGFGMTPNFFQFENFPQTTPVFFEIPETTPGFFGFGETTQEFAEFPETTPNFFLGFNEATTPQPFLFSENFQNLNTIGNLNPKIDLYFILSLKNKSLSETIIVISKRPALICIFPFIF